MPTDEHIIRTEVDCPRCDATFEAEVDISEELARARAEALEEAAKVAEERAAAYPVNIFPEVDLSKEPRKDVQKIGSRAATGMARHTSKMIAEAIRALALASDEPNDTNQPKEQPCNEQS